jgi:hypothetical protein
MSNDSAKKDRISVAAKRAMAEAEARRKAGAASGEPIQPGRPKELGGRKGPEPTRYGDWEKGGIVSDF